MSKAQRDGQRGKHKYKGPRKSVPGVPGIRNQGHKALRNRAGNERFNGPGATSGMPSGTSWGTSLGTSTGTASITHPHTGPHTKYHTASCNDTDWREGGREFENKPNDQRTTSESSLPFGAENTSVLDRSVARSGLGYDSFVRALIGTALSRLLIWDQADLDRLLVKAEMLGLDPLSGEIYAVDAGSNLSDELGESAGSSNSNSNSAIKSPMNCASSRRGVVIVVSVDGWSRIINAHPQFDGMKFFESEPGHDELPLYFECTIFRKDRRVATSVREYMYEAHTGSGAWLTHPRRMLRHKAMVQCARICFGLGGVYEPDEAQRVAQALSESKTKNNSAEFGKSLVIPNKIKVSEQGYENAKEKVRINKSAQLGTDFVKDLVKRQTR
jgi:hypothetical protein